MNEVIMWIMAVGAVLGGIDRILGGRFGLGKKFEDGFMYLGPMALSMVGIICLAPVLAELLGKVAAPLYKMTGVDPAMFGSVLAIDMGGYPLAMQLAENELVGKYAGIIVSSLFGCTLVFSIPVGMEIAEKEDRPAYAKGIMIGLAVMPVSLLVGGLACGLSIGQTLHQTLPILILALLLIVGLYKAPGAMVKGFQVFAAIIKVVITFGLVLAAFTYLTKIEVLPGMAPIEEALSIVGAIGVVQLGSLPLSELLIRALKRPFNAVGKRLGLDTVSVASLLVSFVTALPMFALIKDMNRRGKIMNVAANVGSCALLGAHLGFTMAEEPLMFMPLLAAKMVGAIVGAAVGYFAAGKEEV